MAEEIQMEDGTKKSTIGDYLRSGSCIGDPKVIYEIIELMQSNDNCNLLKRRRCFNDFKNKLIFFPISGQCLTSTKRSQSDIIHGHRQ